MALVGGGGAPNVAGSNPAGIGTSLNYIGEHAYAYSGTFVAATSDQVMLNFTNGANYIIGKIYCNAGIQQDDPSTGITQTWQIDMDGQTIALLKTDSIQEDMPTTVSNKLLIPPFTKVSLTIRAGAAGNSLLASAVFVGEVYA